MSRLISSSPRRRSFDGRRRSEKDLLDLGGSSLDKRARETRLCLPCCSQPAPGWERREEEGRPRTLYNTVYVMQYKGVDYGVQAMLCYPYGGSYTVYAMRDHLCVASCRM
eukprot:6583971-Pyramimonas_sp.AAC.1